MPHGSFRGAGPSLPFTFADWQLAGQMERDILRAVVKGDGPYFFVFSLDGSLVFSSFF